MGVVQRQAIKNNILSYIGIAIGVISQVFIYNKDLDAKGFADGLIKLAALIYPFMTLGVGLLLIRYVPFVKGGERKAKSQLFTLSMKAVTAGLLALTVVVFFFGDFLEDFLVQRGYLLKGLMEYRWAVLALIVCMTYAAILTGNLINFNRIAIPVIFNNLFLKVGLPILIISHFWGWITLDGIVSGLVVIHLCIVVGLLFYSKSQDAIQPDFSPIELIGKDKREMAVMSAYAVFGLLGSSLITNTDVVMINAVLSNTETAVFGFGLFAASVMKAPFQAINTIVLPQISRLWNEKDFPALQSLYQDASAVLVVGGGLIYVGLIICLPYFYPLTEGTAKYATGYYATVFLGGAIVFDLITSINSSLISYSDYFRWSLVFVLFSGGLNLLLNRYFLKVLEWGIEGAALATMTSLLVYNILKLIFIYWKMKIHPFTASLWKSIAAYLAIGTIAWLIPGLGIFWVTGLVKGLTILGLSFLIFRYTNTVPVVKKAIAGGFKSLL